MRELDQHSEHQILWKVGAINLKPWMETKMTQRHRFQLQPRRILTTHSQEPHKERHCDSQRTRSWKDPKKCNEKGRYGRSLSAGRRVQVTCLPLLRPKSWDKRKFCEAEARNRAALSKKNSKVPAGLTPPNAMNITNLLSKANSLSVWVPGYSALYSLLDSYPVRPMKNLGGVLLSHSFK